MVKRRTSHKSREPKVNDQKLLFLVNCIRFDSCEVQFLTEHFDFAPVWQVTVVKIYSCAVVKKMVTSCRGELKVPEVRHINCLNNLDRKG